MTFKAIKLFNKIDTVSGHCEYCGYETILVAIVDELYRCTHCGEDTKQYINGSIRYLKLTNEEKAWAKSQHSE
mgnify:FL=1